MGLWLFIISILIHLPASCYYIQSCFTADEEDPEDTKELLKEVEDFFTGLGGDIAKLNSGDSNQTWAASFNIAARISKLIDKKLPPIGTGLSILFKLAARVRPFRNPEGRSLSDVLDQQLRAAFDRFHDQTLRERYISVWAQMDSKNKDLTFTLQEDSDAQLVNDRVEIFRRFRGNSKDDEPTWDFLKVLETNINLSDRGNPCRTAQRIICYLRLIRYRIGHCRDRASLFSRLTNDDNKPNSDGAHSAAVFWNTNEVQRTIRDARILLSPLANPPSKFTRGFSPVLSCWHKIQSEAQRQELEAFMREELRIDIPGEVLQIYNIAHKEYLMVSVASCPDQARDGFIQIRTKGFAQGATCFWIETSPGSAQQFANTSWSKLFRVYGKRDSFSLWNIEVG